MTIKPLFNYVFIEPITTPPLSKGGILIKKDIEERPNEGMVIAIGNLCRECRIGDKVLFKKYEPDEIELDGKNYIVAREEDILCIK